MKFGKKRKYPDKPANKLGDWCPAYEECGDGRAHCECGGTQNDLKVCKGNRHNCKKTLYHRAASRSNTQIINGEFRERPRPQ